MASEGKLQVRTAARNRKRAESKLMKLSCRLILMRLTQNISELAIPPLCLFGARPPLTSAGYFVRPM